MTFGINISDRRE